jgi:UDP-hydrolysing UDP-N-acetyl-D-glucosamine 2-epimerase
MSRKIAVITGTRAEYGLLYWTIKELQQRGAQVGLVVTGTHLSPAHGMTVKAIEADGFPIVARVDMQLADDSKVGIAQSASLALGGIAKALTDWNADIAVILGDRYEMLAAAMAAALVGVPVAHLHGGEQTEGALDESLRHAITKLSYWHFASAEPYAKRIVQMGEAPERVYHVGATGIDSLARLKLMGKEELEASLGLPLGKPLLLVTYHPETLAVLPVRGQVEELLAALQAFPEATLIFTGANADAGGGEVNQRLQEFAAARGNALFEHSLGMQRYLSAMQLADAVVGNSSSGVIEAPSMGRATVNIGDRQRGRLRAPTVLDCACEKGAIVSALRKALAPEFQAALAPQELFGKPGSVAPAIAQLLCEVEVPKTLRKPFFDR